MKTTKLTLTADLEDGSKMSLSLPAGTEFTYTPTTPVPTPTPTNKKYVMLNCITWPANPLTNLPNEASEYTYFVIPVNANGTLVAGGPGATGTNDALERKFVADVKAKGKKVTFSIAGGAQNVADITAAVTTNRTAFLNNIAAHITQYGYQGIFVDIEGTNIPAATMLSFIKDLRVKLDSITPGLTIGIYVQPYQKDTVWARIQEAVSSFDFLSPMLYDFGPYNKQQWQDMTNAWLPRVANDKSKLLCGVAVNYPAENGGLSPAQYGEVLDMVNANGWRGIGLWQNEIYTQPYRDVLKAKFPNI